MHISSSICSTAGSSTNHDKLVHYMWFAGFVQMFKMHLKWIEILDILAGYYKKSCGPKYKSI